MDDSTQQAKLHRSLELQEAAFSKSSMHLASDPLLEDFMDRLEELSPVPGRDVRNYATSLGFTLAQAGLPYRELEEAEFVKLAAWQNEYIVDVLNQGDVRKLVDAMGAQRTGEFFCALNERFFHAGTTSQVYRVSGRMLSREERAERKAQWLRRTQPARQAIMYELYKVAAEDHAIATPWEWLMELVDTSKLPSKA